MKRLTTNQAAKKLKVCPQRIWARLNRGHFPNASPCECGRTTMIPESDLYLPSPDKRKVSKR